MPRAVRVLVPAAILILLVVLALAPADRVRAATSITDASAQVDYSGAPNFQVGSWVKYHAKGSSLQGYSDDYTATILIAGEEVLWDEPCFWVETWIDRGVGEERTATLISYTAFGDTMTRKHLTWFIRKYINSLDIQGKPIIELAARAGSDLQLRRVNWESAREQLHVRPLGNETLTLPIGTFETSKQMLSNGLATTEELADSTTYYERVVDEIHYLSRKVPITSLVKFDIDDKQRGKTWKAGQFNKDSLRMLERAQGDMTLVAMGQGNLEPKLVPKEFRRPIRDRALVARHILQPQYPPTLILKPGEKP